MNDSEITLKEHLIGIINTLQRQVDGIGEGVRDSVKKGEVVDRAIIMKTIGKSDRVAIEVDGLRSKVDLIENELILAKAKIATHRRYFGYLIGIVGIIAAEWATGFVGL